MHKKDLLQILIDEANSMGQIETIEKMLQTESNLSDYPIQPLYLTIKTLSPEQSSLVLSKLSKKQRTFFLDLDLWERDNLDVESFEYWIKSYHNCPEDEMKEEFVSSEEFALYLKSAVNIWTFDLEDPNYPDHDNYFLTDDNQLLIEFHADFNCVDEVKLFLTTLYGKLGVENAYSYLMKIVSDSHMVFQETEYQQKKERLSDVGVIDYYDALKFDAPFPSINFMDTFINCKSEETGDLDDFSKKQCLHKSLIIAFSEDLKELHQDLIKIDSGKRVDFLSFNFIQTINATITLTGSLKEGPVSLTRTGNNTKALILLGFDYIKNKRPNLQSVFENFLFSEVYKIGNTLIKNGQKRIKSCIPNTAFAEEQKNYFLGQYWLNFFDSSFEHPVKIAQHTENIAKTINSFDLYVQWDNSIKCFSEMVPFIQKFFETFLNLRKSDHLMDSFYINYKLEEVDFETILISALINYSLGLFEDNTINKMGITVEQFKEYAHKTLDSNNKFSLNKEMEEKQIDFIESFGLNNIPLFNSYLDQILREHLEDQDFSTMELEDFKHVGGPLLLHS